MISKPLPLICLCFSLTACLLEDNDNDSPAPTVSTEEIAATGGQIQSIDDRLSLTFPDGALAANTEITIQQLTDDEIADKYPDLEDIDFVYELGPDGYMFLEPIQVTYLLPTDANTDSARALVSVSGGVSESLSEVIFDPETGELSGMLSHFSDVLAVPVGVSVDYPTSVLHNVFGGSLPITATASFDPRNAGAVDSVGGSAGFTPTIASGTEQFISIDEVTSFIPFDQNEPEYGTGSVTISFSCNEAGQDAINYRIGWEDNNFENNDVSLATISGSVGLVTEVTCLATTQTPEEEEPPLPILTSVFVEAGNAPEAIKKAGSPPYNLDPENTLQRFILSGTNLLTIIDIAGVIIETFELFSETFGTLYLQHSTGGDFFFAYGPSGRTLCPMEEGVFCELEVPANTTSAEYGVDANGNEVFNEVYRVRNGTVMFTQEQGELWQEDNFFDNETIVPGAGLTFEQLVPFLFAYEPLTPSLGIGITEGGRGLWIDSNTQTVTEFSDSLGEGLRDIDCAQFSSGEYGCGVQSFTDSTITACTGNSAENFSCSEALAAGDGVSLGVAITDEGNLAIAGGDFTDSSIHAIEVTPTLGIELHTEIPIATWIQTAPDLGISVEGLGHIGIDRANDAFILSGNGSDNAAIINIDEMAEFLELTERLALQKWMGGLTD